MKIIYSTYVSRYGEFVTNNPIFHGSYIIVVDVMTTDDIMNI